MANKSKSCFKYRVVLQLQCLRLFDSKCGRCGCTDVRVLHPYQVSGPLASRLYDRWGVGRDAALVSGKLNPADYECLCANCADIKKVEGSAYPDMLVSEKRYHDNLNLIVSRSGAANAKAN